MFNISELIRDGFIRIVTRRRQPQEKPQVMVYIDEAPRPVFVHAIPDPSTIRLIPEPVDTLGS